jgi:hypothetical protein
VSATSDTGTALSAVAPAGTAAAALFVDGIVQFTRTGFALIKGAHSSPQSSVTVTGIPMFTNSIVFVTPQSQGSSEPLAPGVSVEGVVVDPVNNAFTIRLTQPIKQPLILGWLIIDT